MCQVDRLTASRIATPDPPLRHRSGREERRAVPPGPFREPAAGLVEPCVGQHKRYIARMHSIQRINQALAQLVASLNVVAAVLLVLMTAAVGYTWAGSSGSSSASSSVPCSLVWCVECSRS